MRAVIESPLAGDFVRNFRFALWCARAMWLKEHTHAIGSHMLNPWFMDDTNPAERQAGIDNQWVWQAGVVHCFFTDLGESRGMDFARDRCLRAEISMRRLSLSTYCPEAFEAFERGEWPPHTPGFEVKEPAEFLLGPVLR